VAGRTGVISMTGLKLNRKSPEVPGGHDKPQLGAVRELSWTR
jgi:hypothetical protein